MNKIRFLILISLLIGITLNGFERDGRASPFKAYVPGEVLVKFKSQVNGKQRDRILNQHRSLRLRDLNTDGLSHVLLLNGQNIEKAVQTLRRHPEIDYVQPNFIYKVHTSPNDPGYQYQWALKNTGQTVIPVGINSPTPPLSGQANNDIGVESAWDYIVDCSSIVVAVLDSGVNYNQVDLVNNMWNGGTLYQHGMNFIDGTNDPMDNNGHGTHVAGVIGASGNNGAGTTGICWKANIMALKVLDATGSGTTASITQGIAFATANGAKIINLSLGDGSYNNADYDPAFDSAILNAAQLNVLVVTSSGNSGADLDSGTTPNYPCSFNESNMICVTALDPNFDLLASSNYGSKSVTIGAPGLNIISEWAGTSEITQDPLTTSCPSSTLSAGCWSGSSVKLSGYESNTTGWGASSLTSGGTTIQALTNPANYDRNIAKYVNGTDDRVYQPFPIPSTSPTPTIAILSYQAIYDTENSQTGQDVFYTGYLSAVGDPFASGRTISSISGSSNGSLDQFQFDISPCILNNSSRNCTIGFRFQSDTAGINYGVAVTSFQLQLMTLNTTSYEIYTGTSMAAAMVSGVAALLMSYNPQYTYADVIHAIKNGSFALSTLTGKTSTGSGIHAMGALSYINPPTGLAGSVH